MVLLRITYIKEYCKCIHYCKSNDECKKFIAYIKAQGVTNITIDNYVLCGD